MEAEKRRRTFGGAAWLAVVLVVLPGLGCGSTDGENGTETISEPLVVQ